MSGKKLVEIIDKQKHKEEDETWTVHPTPGICVKFKKDSESNLKRSLITNEDVGGPTFSNKFFINLAHCIEIPSPPKELWKDEEIIAKMMENDKNSFKIPMCVGEVENVEDHNGNISTKVFLSFFADCPQIIFFSNFKVDVIVNSEFFEKCINNSEFFRQITLAAICEKIKVCRNNFL
ncbi:unnamed protein product [Meloidogyne enterolobii]|uniref:Uncharacterized protein n=1 Tax=Meloidogyne enterolobii TaxID=390850 RepID=A0ACB1ACW8_MELEN